MRSPDPFVNPDDDVLYLSSRVRNRFGYIAAMDAVLHALADESRRTVLEILRDHPATAGELAEALPIARPGVSRHLRVLREAGLVDVRQEAQRRIYSLRPEALDRGGRVAGGVPRALAEPARRPAHRDRPREEGTDDEHHRDDAGTRRDPRSGAGRGRLRHGHRRPVGGVYDAGAAGALDRRGLRRPARGRHDPRRLHEHLDRSGAGRGVRRAAPPAAHDRSRAPTTRRRSRRG